MGGMTYPEYLAFHRNLQGGRHSKGGQRSVMIPKTPENNLNENSKV